LFRLPHAAAWHCTAVEQPHAPALQTGPALHVVVQSLQTPLVPQAKLAVPTAHAPVVLPEATEQQPPLHGCAALHVVVHVCEVPSHAWPVAQSAGPLQPHVPFASHAFP
jgi:hypothetical protein